LKKNLRYKHMLRPPNHMV